MDASVPFLGANSGDASMVLAKSVVSKQSVAQGWTAYSTSFKVGRLAIAAAQVVPGTYWKPEYCLSQIPGSHHKGTITRPAIVAV